MKILILGGYGVFGGRLAELLADIADVELLIAGRNFDHAKEFCDAFAGAANAVPLLLDRHALQDHLAALAPNLVVDASGPFQDYGNDKYSVIKACIQFKVNYMDFADAADFVFGVSAFDQQAKDAGVFILSGVSSFPVLTAAVLREMSKSMEIVSVKGGIAPSPFAGIGLNVMRAVLGYAGSPVKLTRDGKQTTALGLTESMRYAVAVPGKIPLKNLRFSLVDVPDLQVLPPEHPTMQNIWMGAGPVPESLHHVLNLLAKARATFGLPSLTPLSALCYRVLNIMKFGDHRGGMFVHVAGHSNGVPVEKSWHLLAEGADGPYIPSMAIEALIRKILVGEVPANGARPATRALSLDDYDRLFKNRAIFTGMRDEPQQDEPLFRQILGMAFEKLPSELRAFHEVSQETCWTGSAQVRRGEGIFARVLAWGFGLPEKCDQTTVNIRVSPQHSGEQWTRTIGDKSFSSILSKGSGSDENLLVKRFGGVKVAIALVLEEGKLFFVPRRMSLFSLPLPAFLLPAGKNYEAVSNQKFKFDIEFSAPFIGLIAAYKGELKRVQQVSKGNSTE